MDTDAFAAQALAQVLDFALVLLSMALAWVAKEAITWLQARRKKEGNDYLNDLLQRVVRAAEVTVASNMNTIVAQLREDAADGKIDKAEAKRLLDNTTDRVLAYLGEDAVRDAESIMKPTAFRDFVQEAIEAEVAKWKKGNE